jgi:hypothetical protein
LTTNESIPSVWPGVQGLDAKTAALDDIALVERPVGAAGQAISLEAVREHGRARIARPHRLEVRDVVAMVVSRARA